MFHLKLVTIKNEQYKHTRVFMKPQNLIYRLNLILFLVNVHMRWLTPNLIFISNKAALLFFMLLFSFTPINSLIRILKTSLKVHYIYIQYIWKKLPTYLLALMALSYKKHHWAQRAISPSGMLLAGTFYHSEHYKSPDRKTTGHIGGNRSLQWSNLLPVCLRYVKWLKKPKSTMQAVCFMSGGIICFC